MPDDKKTVSTETDTRPCDGCDRDYEFVVDKDRGYCDGCYAILLVDQQACYRARHRALDRERGAERARQRAAERAEWQVAIAESAKQRAKQRATNRAWLSRPVAITRHRR